MTNKTEMVSVPRELLQDLIDSAQLEVDERLRAYGEDYRPHVLAAQRKVVADACAILAAPAEDVRAVVDEPVAYSFRWDFEHGNGWQRNALRYVERLEGHEHEDHRSTWRDITPLYLHPQRPDVVDELEGKLAIRNITIEQLTRKVEELEELVTDLRGNARE